MPDQRAGVSVSDSTPHLYGCKWRECREFATTRLEWWEPGWGWDHEGDYCDRHLADMESIAEQDEIHIRKEPIRG